MRRLAALAFAAAAGCAPRVRVDLEHIAHVETIAPVTFVANHYIGPPGSFGTTGVEAPDPSDATGNEIFEHGVEAFLAALERTERFRVLAPKSVLDARAYEAFPRLEGVNASAAVTASGWRFVTPQDTAKIEALLAETGADAALLTYWHFGLDLANQGLIDADASPRVHLRAWLVARDGKVIADQEYDVASDDLVPLRARHYERASLPPMFLPPIERCAVRLAADLSNARSKARGE